MVNELKSFLNKHVKIIFDDGHGVATREGTLEKLTKDFVFLENKNNNVELAIPIDRIVRIEVENQARENNYDRK